MEFAKLHGLGNDFLIIPAALGRQMTESLATIAQKVCHRHCGVGADGVMYYETAFDDQEAEYVTRIFNADGSEAEMSGNGIRCLAAFLHKSGRCSSSSISIRTPSGVKALILRESEGSRYIFECAMGVPITNSKAIIGNSELGPGPIVGHQLAVGDKLVRVTLSSMGNPHCSTFWPDLGVAPIDILGPALEGHEIFPSRANVEFIQVLDRHRLRVRFWERGVGRTLASGTGSSAAAVASILHGFTETPVTVETEMGALVVRWRAGEQLFLTGPAEFICSGEINLNDLDGANNKTHRGEHTEPGAVAPG
jgi:diaminopimelate epimerase